MTQAGPLHWRTGTGWLVLAGGGEWQTHQTGAIDAAALGWAIFDRPIAVVVAAGGSTAESEALLDYFAELGGPSGYIVPIFGAADAHRAAHAQLLSEAGLVYVSDGPDVLGLVRALRGSVALEAMVQAFEDGAVIVGMGAGAIALGAYVADQETPTQTDAGWGWLQGIVVEPHFTGTESAARMRAMLNAHPDCLGLGIPDGIALALGPDGRVETVGEGQVTVVVSAMQNGSAHRE